MPLDEINRCIAEYEQYNFIFTDDFLLKIRAKCNSWKNDWVESFKKILRKIRKGEEGSPAYDKENGRRLTVPLVKNRYMAVFFNPQTNGSYFVYGFELEIKDTI